MGIPITQKTITLEKRLKNIFIQRNLVNNSLSITIESETGYYDADNKWVKIDNESYFLDGDLVLVLMSTNKNTFPNTKIGELIEAMAYGIISGTIKTNATFNVVATDIVTGEPIQAKFGIIKNNRILHEGITGIPLNTPVYINVKVLVQAEGYAPVEISYPLVQGEVNISVQMNRI